MDFLPNELVLKLLCSLSCTCELVSNAGHPAARSPKRVLSS